MGQKKISSSLSPKVHIQAAQGNLKVKGWDRPEVLLRASDIERNTLDIQDDNVQIKCHGDCMIRLPHDAEIQADAIQGNVRFKLLEGRLKIEEVSGSLDLRNIESAEIATVTGNMLAKQVTDDLLVERVKGNAIARDVQGQCTLKQVGGNLDLRDAEGDIETSAGGNVRVRLNLLGGQSYRIKAGGNLHCQVADDSSLHVDLTSTARRIQIKQDGEKSTLAEEKHSLTIGNGDTPMALEAKGSILFTSQEAGWTDTNEIQDDLDEAFAEFSEEFGQQVANQVEIQIDTQMEILNDQLFKLESMIGASDMPPEEAERTMRRAREASDRANVRAQEKMRRAQEKLDRKLQAAQRKAELKMRAAERRKGSPKKPSWGFEMSTASTPPAEAPSDEERLIILRMLEEKKISLDEAEELLAALEGKQG